MFKFSLVRSLFCMERFTRPRKPRPIRRRGNLTVEALEDRTLMAAGLNAALWDGADPAPDPGNVQVAEPVNLLAAGVTINAGALSSATLMLDGQRYDTTAPFNVALQPGEHYMYVTGNDGIWFTVDANGAVNYDPALDLVLSGRGSANLTVHGQTITMDASELSATSLMLDGQRYATAAAFPVTLLPGDHYFHTSGNDGIWFKVAINGAIKYDPALEGVLTGRSTGKLTVHGRSVQVDASALGMSQVQLDGQAYNAAAPFTVRLLPGGHTIYSPPTGYVWFTVAADGTISYDPSSNIVLTAVANRPPVTATLEADGVLRVVGTDLADSIRVIQNGSDISVEGINISVFVNGVVSKAPSVSIMSVSWIEVFALGDNDHVVIDNSQYFAWLTPVYVFGGSGHDVLEGGVGDDYLAGDAGHDILIGYAGDDTLFGGKGMDTLYGDDPADPLAGTGSDRLFGEDDSDTLVGCGGEDFLYGGYGADTLYGNGGIDTLEGSTGGDTLFGGTGNDNLDGGDGDDLLLGQEGNDTIMGGNDHDTAWGGTGIDHLFGGSGNDTLLGEEDGDFLHGEDGDDRLFGGDGMDWLWGGNHTDRLWGGIGDDYLYGNGGLDYLMGEAGRDWLSGGDDNNDVGNFLWGGSDGDYIFRRWTWKTVPYGNNLYGSRQVATGWDNVMDREPALDMIIEVNKPSGTVNSGGTYNPGGVPEWPGVDYGGPEKPEIKWPEKPEKKPKK